jgi:hypothetical protein
MKTAKAFTFALFALLSVSVRSYGANAVGYVNVSLLPGYNLIANPLYANDNSVSSLFTSGVQGVMPDGLTVSIMENGAYHTTRYDSLAQSFLPEAVAQDQLLPGRGFFVFNPTSTNVTVTFVGQVVWGSLHLPSGYSFVGSVVPKAASWDQLNFPAEQGDRVYRWNAFQQVFETSVYDDLDRSWLPSNLTLGVAEGFVVYKRQPAEWYQPNPIIPGTP